MAGLAFAELEKFEQSINGDGSLSFLVIGDWGRRGEFNQSEVAFQMGRIGEKLGINFVVSTGDNFYDDGLSGEDDPAFEESFSKIYTAKSLQKQWYSELAEIFFIDTTPFVKMYFTNEEGHIYDWRGVKSRKPYTTNLLKDLEVALRESSAKWKIVIGHHAIRSIGHHGDTEELIKRVLPLLKSMASLHYLSLREKCFYLCFCFCFLPLSSAELWQFQHPVKADGSLSFLVIGDWGRRGAYNQSQVAFQMGRIGEDLNIDFVVSTGDNFYDDGLKSVNDLLFQESFTQIYTANSLQKQWYNEIADFFFVDTTPFVDKYFLKPNKHTYDWRGIIPRKKYLAKILRDVELAMRKSAANWKIVVGHHTMRSIGHHADTKELVQHLLPILEANNADMYINGHDHCLQHISSTRSPIQFLTSGGGSKAWKGEIDKRNRNGTRFYYDGQGFMSIQLTEAEARIIFYDVFGRALHNLNLFKQLNSAM
ncbi:hypothetical protein Patl1_19546 [Pistacia atlantica]|uniref:Uncharacterized protein n=1 Tax=Pistacia atlantica TaxID=434234 RepID=A0ACC1BZF9_9ROSI|nr:hypothetical protein Patl1_19546 [Pistacia atlantica]